MKKELTKLDELVKKGQILEAFDTFFADDVITADESGNQTTSKVQKRAMLVDFLNEFKVVKEINLFDSFINGDTSYSHFEFVLANSANEVHRWKEVIIRKWNDKQLVISEFYSNENYDTLKNENTPKAKVKTTKEKAAKEEKKVSTTAPATSEEISTTKVVKKVSSKKAVSKGK